MTKEEAIQQMIKFQWADYVDFDKLHFIPRGQNACLFREVGRGEWYITRNSVTFHKEYNDDFGYLPGR